MPEFQYLFEDTKWGTVSAKFQRIDLPPPAQMIANVNLVPYVGQGWVVIRLEDGQYEVPGGTLDAGENYLDGVVRELREEAGAEVLSFRPIGAWLCRSNAEKPYKPHLPHPQFVRFVGVGEVELVSTPTNPPDGEKVAAVEVLPLESAIQKFTACGRPDLADLYRLAAQIRAEDEARYADD